MGVQEELRETMFVLRSHGCEAGDVYVHVI